MSTDSNNTQEHGLDQMIQAFVNDANAIFEECLNELMETYQTERDLLQRVKKLNEEAIDEGKLLEEELRNRINLVRQHLNFVAEIEK